MLPSRGLRPRQIVPLGPRYALITRSGPSRKFSSLPRKSAVPTSSCRAGLLRSANWRAGATPSSNVLITTSSVRYGSWYAPWSWGRSSTPSDTIPTPEPVVTTFTPELAPAGIDKSAVIATENATAAASSTPKTIEDLLVDDPSPSLDPTSIVDPTVPVSYWGNLKDLGLDYGWGPTAFFENLVELSYLNTTLGWSGSILASSLVLRFIIFWAFQRPGSDATAKVAAMKPLLQPMMDEMEAAKRAGDEEKASQLKMKQGIIMKEVGADLFKSMYTPLAQMVLGFGAFRCLRGMSSLPVPGMTTEGWLWFTDLTVADPFYILPVATAASMFVVIKIGGETGVNNQTQVTSLQKQIQFAMPLLLLVITSWQPAALQLYFFMTSTLGGITGLALRQPGFRRAIRIRQLPTPESNELYGKVVSGEIPLKSIRGTDGKIRYQAPRSMSSKDPSPTPSKTTLSSGINIKPGTILPAHLRTRTDTKDNKERGRDVDFEAGMPKGWDVGAKWDWLKRNYRPSMVAKRLKTAHDPRDASVKAQQERKEKAKQAAKKYELERKRRFESGR